MGFFVGILLGLGGFLMLITVVIIIFPWLYALRTKIERAADKWAKQ